MFPPIRISRPRVFRPLVAGLLGLALAAPAPGGGAAPAHDARPAGVAWFPADVDAAFAAARDTHKPVFLYWSAVWCPPCQELKATVFHRRDFLDRLGLFVAVYIDGDAPGAQALGERFHVTGYPTALVLRADAAEIERVSGGMDLGRYAEVLDLALNAERPAHALLDALGQSEAPLTESECRQLAYFGWQLDERWLMDPTPQYLETMVTTLGDAAQRCPGGLRTEKARLLLTAVTAGLAAERAPGGPPASASLQALLDQVPAVLRDRRLALAVGDTLYDQGPGFFAALAGPQAAAHAAFLRQWFALMDALAADQRYSEGERLYALRSKLIAAKALDPAGRIPPALARAVRARIDQGLARTSEPYARAAFVNAALNTLQTLDDTARARALLEAEVRTAQYPYYYMADLAELEEKLGHADAALELYARSYHTAQGPATRFQWGTQYVRVLVRLRAADEDAIAAATLEVLGELDPVPDLHGRTRRRLERLDAALRQWNRGGAHAQAIAALRTRMDGICIKIPETDTARGACWGFLAGG